MRPDITQCFWPVSSSTLSVKKLMLNTVCGIDEPSVVIEKPEREGAGKLTHTKVAGRKARVTTAMVFIDALSLLAALLISTVALLSRWTTRLKPYQTSVDFVHEPDNLTRLISFESLSFRDFARRSKLRSMPSQNDISLWGQCGLGAVPAPPGHPQSLLDFGSYPLLSWVRVSTATARTSQI